MIKEYFFNCKFKAYELFKKSILFIYLFIILHELIFKSFIRLLIFDKEDNKRLEYLGHL
jgi:hypothetical protein